MAERLDSYISSLPQDNWSLPSRCDIWEVADVLAHLTAGAARQRERMEQGRQGWAAADRFLAARRGYHVHEQLPARHRPSPASW